MFAVALLVGFAAATQADPAFSYTKNGPAAMNGETKAIESVYSYQADIVEADDGVKAVITTETKGTNSDSSFGTNLGKNLVTSCFTYGTGEGVLKKEGVSDDEPLYLCRTVELHYTAADAAMGSYRMEHTNILPWK